MGRLNMCGFPGDIPHTSTQRSLASVYEYQLLHLEGDLLKKIIQELAGARQCFTDL